VITTVDTQTASSNAITSAKAFTTTGVLSAPTFANYSAAYQELRVLAMELRWSPTFLGQGPLATTTQNWPTAVTPLYILPFKGNATVIGNQDAAANHFPQRICVINQTAVMKIKMDESGEADFVSVASATVPAIFGFKTFFQATTIAAAAVIAFGTWTCTYLVQFRGRVDGSSQVSLPSRRALASSVRGAGELLSTDGSEHKDAVPPLRGAASSAAAVVRAAEDGGSVITTAEFLAALRSTFADFGGGGAGKPSTSA